MATCKSLGDLRFPGGSLLLAINPQCPRELRTPREGFRAEGVWSIDQFDVLKELEKGPISHIALVHDGLSGKTLVLKIYLKVSYLDDEALTEEIARIL
jgi:hypothetical protein